MYQLYIQISPRNAHQLSKLLYLLKSQSILLLKHNRVKVLMPRRNLVLQILRIVSFVHAAQKNMMLDARTMQEETSIASIQKDTVTYDMF